MEPTATAPASAPPTSATAERVAHLRELAGTEPARAQNETWAWFKQLGKDGDEDGLRELFGLGTAPSGLDGPTEGILVLPMISRFADAPIGLITKAWMPWLGKSFNSSQARGYNRLAMSARWPAKLLWPRYGTRDDPGARAAFDFETAVEPGRMEPEVDVLKIDYEPVTENPNLVIRKIRDELVEIAPDTYLGRILWSHGEGRYSLIGYFALRQPAG